MTTQRTYSLDCTPALPVQVTTQAAGPAAALRQLVDLSGLCLVTQDGRYGRCSDGTLVAAFTVDAGRRRYADHGTTRPGAPA